MNNNLFSKYFSNPELLVQNLLDLIQAKDLLDLLDIPVILENEFGIDELINLMTEEITDDIRSEVCETVPNYIDTISDNTNLSVIYDCITN